MASTILSTADAPSHLIIIVATQSTNQQVRVREYLRLGPSRKKMTTKGVLEESLIRGLFTEVREGLRKSTGDGGIPQGLQQWGAIASYRSEEERSGRAVTSTYRSWGCSKQEWEVKN